MFSQPMSYDITGRNRVKVSSETLARAAERWAGCCLRWEVRDSHGFGCEAQEFSLGCAKLETSVKRLSWDVESERKMGEFPVGGMSGRDAEMRVIGVQTPKSRRWKTLLRNESRDKKTIMSGR